MKKTLIIVLLATLSLGLAYADVHYGIRGGLNLTNMRTTAENSIVTGDKTGFHAGLMMQYRTDANFIVQPEILYTQKGYTYEVLTVNSTVSMDYVEVPILLKYDIKAAKGLNIQPVVAPYVGYAVIAKVVSKGLLIDTDVDMIEEINKIDYGVGLGLDIQIIDRVVVGARYQFGFADFDGNDNVLEEDVSLTHNGILISLGFLF